MTISHVILYSGKEFVISEGEIMELQGYKDNIKDYEVLCSIDWKNKILMDPPKDQKINFSLIKHKKGTKIISYKFRRRKGFHRMRNIRPQKSIFRVSFNLILTHGEKESRRFIEKW